MRLASSVWSSHSARVKHDLWISLKPDGARETGGVGLLAIDSVA
jgi:hypothetical protein